MKSFKLWLFLALSVVSYFVGTSVDPVYKVEQISLDVTQNDDGEYIYTYKGKAQVINPVTKEESHLNPAIFGSYSADHITEFVNNDKKSDFITFQEEGKTSFAKLSVKKHYGAWSLLPAFVAVLLCCELPQNNWTLFNMRDKRNA